MPSAFGALEVDPTPEPSPYQQAVDNAEGAPRTRGWGLPVAAATTALALIGGAAYINSNSATKTTKPEVVMVDVPDSGIESPTGAESYALSPSRTADNGDDGHGNAVADDDNYMGCQAYTFETHPVEATVAAGTWSYDLTYHEHTGLASGDTSANTNMLVFHKTQSADVYATTKMMSKVNNKNWALGIRMTKYEGAPTGDYCQGYTGYVCYLDMNEDNDDSSKYKIGIKKCGSGGIVTVIGESNIYKGSKGMLNDEWYHVEFQGVSAKLTCAVMNEAGNELGTITVADGAMKDDEGKAMLATMGMHNHFFDEMYVCDLAPTSVPTPAPTLIAYEPTATPTVYPTDGVDTDETYCAQAHSTTVDYGGFIWNTSYHNSSCLLKSAEDKNNILTTDVKLHNVKAKLTYLMSAGTTYQVSQISLRQTSNEDAPRTNWCKYQDKLVCVAQVKSYKYVKLELMECDSEWPTNYEFTESALVDFQIDRWHTQTFEAKDGNLYCALYDSKGDLLVDISADEKMYNSTKLATATGDVGFGAYGEHYFFKSLEIEELSDEDYSYSYSD